MNESLISIRENSNLSLEQTFKVNNIYTNKLNLYKNKNEDLHFILSLYKLFYIVNQTTSFCYSYHAFIHNFAKILVSIFILL